MSTRDPTMLWDRLMRPVHHWVWADPERRIRKLILFGEVETDGGRDILRAAEVTPDPLLRRLYLEHAIDELRHGELFRARSEALQRARGRRARTLFSGTPLPGGHGLDDLSVDQESDPRLLAFLHVAEKSAAGRFAVYRECVNDDPVTREIFEQILRDEVFHMNYSYAQLGRLSPQATRRHIWWARSNRLWKRYLRLVAGLASVVSCISLTIVYFVLLPPFAWAAKRAARRQPAGWVSVPNGPERPTSQY